MGWLLLLVLYLSNASVRARLVAWVLRPRKPFALQVAIQAIAGALVGFGLFVVFLPALALFKVLVEGLFG